MPTATVVKAWKDSSKAHLAIRVVEASGNVEYIGSVPLADLAGKTPAEQKAALVAAVKAIRDAQVPSETPIAISGTVVV